MDINRLSDASVVVLMILVPGILVILLKLYQKHIQHGFEKDKEKQTGWAPPNNGNWAQLNRQIEEYIKKRESRKEEK